MKNDKQITWHIDKKTKKEEEEKEKKTNRQKHQKTKRQRPKRQFYIVTSGQFRTLAMFIYLAVHKKGVSSKSAPNRCVSCPKTISSQKVVKVRQIGTFLVLGPFCWKKSFFTLPVDWSLKMTRTSFNFTSKAKL